jgi:tetratricopeptide (TPR) repeat protein
MVLPALGLGCFPNQQKGEEKPDDKAAAEAQKATAQHLRQAQRAFDRQRYQEAWAHLTKANDLQPRSPEIQLRLARVARLLGHFKQADQHLNRCKDLRGEHTEEEQLERLMLRAQTGEVEKVLSKLWPYVEKKRPEASLVLEALSYGFLGQELYVPAQRCLNEWEKIDPDNIQALLYGGWFLDRNGGGSPESREKYLHALELDPSRTDIRLRLAQAYLNQQNDRKAIEHFKQVLKQQPDNEMAQLGLAQATLSMGKSEEARELLRTFLLKHPDNALALREIGKVELNEGHYAEAEKWLRRALKYNPNDGLAMYSLLTCLRRRGDKPEVKAEIAKIDARMKMINVAGRRLDELIRNKMLAHPKDPELYYEAGTIYEQLGEEKEAAAWYARALRYDPKHQRALKAAVKYLKKIGDNEQADELRRRITEKE